MEVLKYGLFVFLSLSGIIIIYLLVFEMKCRFSGCFRIWVWWFSRWSGYIMYICWYSKQNVYPVVDVEYWFGNFKGLSRHIMYICKFSNSNVDPLCSGVNGVHMFFSLSGLNLLIRIFFKTECRSCGGFRIRIACWFLSLSGNIILYLWVFEMKCRFTDRFRIWV